MNRSDNFNRSNGTLAGSTPSDSGSAWAGTGGTLSGNAARGGSSSGVWLESNASDVDVRATYSTAGTGFERACVKFRTADASNQWFAQIREGATPGVSTGSLTVVKRVAGTDTQVGSTVTGLTLAMGDIWRVNCVGDTIRVYHTPIGTGVESLKLTLTGQTDHQTATKHGLGGTNNGSVHLWDNFSITDLATPSGGIILISDWW